jgi:predicted branched-subunit amino acid permease
VIDEGGESSARRSFISGLRAGIWVAVAGMLVGVSFGVLAEPLMGEVAPIVMSAAMFAGSAQFAATAVLSAGGGAVAAIVAGVLLNARYAPMGIALAPSLRGGPLRRAAIGQTMIDFAWAAANRGGGRFDPAFMVGVSAPCYVLWVAGTALGVFAAGDLIGDPGALGLDAIFPAFFLCLLVEGELRPGLPAVVAGLGSVVAFVLIPFTPAGVPIIAASTCALLGLMRPSK